MHRNRLARTLVPAGLTLALGVLCLASPLSAKTKIVSSWLDREIAIDGEIDEWRDTLTFVRSVDAFVAMFNDDESLYLCLYSQSPDNAKQFASDGLRVKLEGGRNGAFTVLLPKSDASTGGSVVELQVAGNRDAIVVAASGEAGVEASASHRGSFVYELKIPLTANDGRPWAPGLAAGDKFKLVIDNPQLDTLAEELDKKPRHRNPVSPGVPGSGGQMGRPDDPGWNGRVDGDDPFFTNRLVFLLKARVELAERP